MEMDLQKVLLEKRNELQKNLARNIEFLREREDTEEESAMNCAQMETNELNRVATALSKMRDGTYGKCEDCGVKIPRIRLEALPHTTRCLECQRILEGEEVEDDVQWERLAERGMEEILEERIN
jgi:DnaK suppressor protein